MAAHDVVVLNQTTSPKEIQEIQTGDTFEMSKAVNITGALTVTGTINGGAVLKSNLVATTSPDADQDADEGYVVGSLWINVTLDLAFICLDSTNTAAVWLLLPESTLVALRAAELNVQTGTSYTVLAADSGKVIVTTNGAAIAVTLPDGLAIAHQFSLIQAGAGVPTVTPATDTVNGAGAGVTPSAQWKAAYFVQFLTTEWAAIL